MKTKKHTNIQTNEEIFKMRLNDINNINHLKDKTLTITLQYTVTVDLFDCFLLCLCFASSEIHLV